MNAFTSLLRQPLTIAALLGVPGAAQAVLTVYTDPAAFAAAVALPATDAFTDLAIGSTPTTPLTRRLGSYGYTASSFDGLYVFSGADRALSTGYARDQITLSGFTGGVGAISVNFYVTNNLGAVQEGRIEVGASDSSGRVMRIITAVSADNFLGFVSTGSLMSLYVEPVSSMDRWLFPAIDNLTLAAASVPEPGSAVLLLAGVGLMTIAGRRLRG